MQIPILANYVLEKLDNPVWHSLSETHREFAIDYGDIKFYQLDYCPFGAFRNPGNISAYITQYAGLTGEFFIVGGRPEFPGSVRLKKELVSNQMIIHERTGIEITEDIKVLGEDHAAALYNLVNLVQPGYFRSRTFRLGDYYGIFKNGQLVAVTGERMKMAGLTEVSAVVTHPDHTGKNYAKQLVTHTINRIMAKNSIPFLHVAETNSAAIGLYEKLGFKTRRKISFWNLVAD